MTQPAAYAAYKRFSEGKTLAQGEFSSPEQEKKGVPTGPGPWGVKGHADNPYNNRCDELAVSEWQKLKK